MSFMRSMIWLQASISIFDCFLLGLPQVGVNEPRCNSWVVSIMKLRSQRLCGSSLCSTSQTMNTRKAGTKNGTGLTVSRAIRA